VRKHSWVVGVLALILAMLFGATIGVPTSHSGIAHRLLAPDHHDPGTWSGGDGDTRQPLMLHAEGEQVETPEAAGHTLAQLSAVPSDKADPQRARVLFLQALLNHNDFVTLR
jgi:hypothetical protein